MRRLRDEAPLFVELIDTLQDLGIELPSAAYVLGVVLFGIVGMVAFWKGRKLKRPRVKWLGVALMFYPVPGVEHDDALRRRRSVVSGALDVSAVVTS